MIHSNLKKNDVVLIGFPFDNNCSYRKGAALAPSCIRRRLYSESTNLCTENEIDLNTNKNWHDFGEIECVNPEDYFKIIEASITKIIDKDALILSLGGDHSITYPILKSYSKKYKKLTVLHFDAHPDLYNIFDNNPFSHASPFARIMENKLIDNLIQVGIRTINPHQKEQINRFNIKTVEMKNFSYQSLDNILSQIKNPLYISFDLDVLDPAFAPGVSHHEPGGFSTRQILEILQKINTSNLKVVGADIVELNPKNDINSMTATVSAKLLKEIIAMMISKF
ncbi:MAG: agmatinase [Desulfobacteraceae bacterium]|nr:agmatinase [Desulfobacteraceae bacterium]